MQISHLNPQPFHQTPFLNAGRNGGTVRERLPWLRGTVTGLPAELDALLITSDLQGRGVSGPPRPLLGEVVAAEYAQNCAAWGLPQPQRVGVLLAGDYYAAPAADKRGATGDVFPVWQAFAGSSEEGAFVWVVGVLGNHDTLATLPAGGTLLEAEAVQKGGLCIGGVSGVVGNPRRHARHEWPDYAERVALALAYAPDLLLLHTPPHVDESRRGEAALLPLLARPKLLTVCGHVHWETPLATLPNGAQVLNVDSRVVVLVRQ